MAARPLGLGLAEDDIRRIAHMSLQSSFGNPWVDGAAS